MKDIKEIFINNLVYYRKKANLSQQELSQKINCSFNYINGLENNNSTPSLEKIQEIANILEIKPSDLLQEEGCPKNYVHFNKNEFVSKLANEVQENTNSSIKEKIDLIVKNY